MPRPKDPTTVSSLTRHQVERKVRVSVAGASGYAGAELVRWLHGHPGVELVRLAAGEQSGRSSSEVFPHLRSLAEHPLEPSDWGLLGSDAEVVFLALPHGLAMDAVPELLASGARVIDLGADFRLNEASVFESWYGMQHRDPDRLVSAVYGLPELHRERLVDASLVACPGCYPTATSLALLPLAELLDDCVVIVDAKSGVSGAGRKAALGTSYSEVNENLRPYGVLNHRHTPEIEQTLATAGARATSVLFTPHLVPMTRGILATCYVDLRSETSADFDTEALLERYRQHYRGEAFVRVLASDQLPETKLTLGTNLCDVTVRVDRSRGVAIAFGAIDNLGKGAAGQAIQCFNTMVGNDERCGLDAVPLYP